MEYEVLVERTEHSPALVTDSALDGALEQENLESADVNAMHLSVETDVTATVKVSPIKKSKKGSHSLRGFFRKSKLATQAA